METKRLEFSAYLPEPKDLERFMVSAAFAIGRNPKILECTRESIMAAAFIAAELRLDFTPALGLAYIVPYKENGVPKAQFQIGYRGLGTLAVRCGAIIGFEAHVVHELDSFEHELGTGGFIRHTRPKLGNPRGAGVGAYAIVTLPGGYKQFDVMDRMEIDAIRARSIAYKFGGGPWKTDDAEMRKKTVMKRLAKYLNLSPDIGKALEADNADTDFDAVVEQAPPPLPRADKIDALIEQPPATTESPPDEQARIKAQEATTDPKFPLA